MPLTSPKKVMIVDDEPDIVAIIELALKSSGYRAEGFTSSARAAEEIRNSSDYALVISDVRMPGMDGFELARNIKEARPDVNTVLMTAFEINEFSSLLPSATVAELVTKPFTNAQLIGIVRKYVGATEQH